MGQDGALWFTENSGNKIERITTASVITEFPVPTSSSGPRGIVAGPDGARESPPRSNRPEPQKAREVDTAAQTKAGLTADRVAELTWH